MDDIDLKAEKLPSLYESLDSTAALRKMARFASPLESLKPLWATSKLFEAGMGAAMMPTIKFPELPDSFFRISESPLFGAQKSLSNQFDRMFPANLSTINLGTASYFDEIIKSQEANNLVLSQAVRTLMEPNPMLEAASTVLSDTVAQYASLSETMGTSLSWAARAATAIPSSAILEAYTQTRYEFPAPKPVIRAKGSNVIVLNVRDLDTTEPGDLPYRLIGILERKVRDFIQDILLTNIGPNWEVTAVHPATLKKWREKQATGIRNGDDPGTPLIEYADFTDYAPLIIQKSNWPWFKIFFRSPENVEIRFQSLYPLRVNTMHFRPIPQQRLLVMAGDCQSLLLCMNDSLI